MQPFEKQINLSATPQLCARELLEVTPAIIQAIRVEMRAQRQHDLSVPQFRTLAYISHKPGSSLSAAADHIGLTLPTMSVLVEGLVQRGLVQRVPDLRDRRRVLLTLTAEGKTLHEHALQGTASALEILLAPLAVQDREVILCAMQVLRPLFMGATAPTLLVQE